MNRNTIQALAVELAVSQKRVTSRLFKSPFENFIITSQQEAIFDKYYEEVENHSFDDSVPDSATEWLIDNYYAIKMQLKSIKRSIKNIPVDIPVLSDGIMKGFPRIYALAVEYIDFNGGVVNQNGLIEFLSQYQKELPLNLDELWSLSAAFSLALARNIMTLACRKYEALVSARDIRTVADMVCANKDGKLDSLDSFVNVNDAPKLASFITVIQNKPDSSAVLRWLDSELSRLNMTANEVLEFSRHIESNCAITIRNSITSLMHINMFDWEGIFSSVCIADTVFAGEPDGTYAKMDAESKNMYRRKLKKAAKKLKMDETECARMILQRAQDENCHIGKILFEDEQKNTFRKKCFYMVSVYLLTFIIFGASLTALHFAHINIAIHITAALLFYIPCKNIALVAVNYVSSKIVKPMQFVRLDFEKEIPEECKTAVVIPALIVNKAQGEQLVKNMEINYLANKTDNISFVLLGDYVDSDCEKEIDDEQIRQCVNGEINALNAKYGKKLFFYMQRPRLYNKNQKRWFGWERKRGAVIQFNRFLQSGDTKDFSFVSAGIESIVKSKYVITLDADTKMPPNSAFSLVGTAHHPMNRPVFDAATRTVKSGYGILQPRMEVGVPSALKTHFSHIMAGAVGSEPYISAASEVYQDIFNEGSFGGKGIYDSEIFCSVIDGRFPENAILSHDMIEGGYLHAGYVSDIAFSDDIPSNYVSFRKRAHRWMRGDWQLLPYLFPVVKNSDGKRMYNYLSGVTKYKVYENLRRTLYEPVICILLAIGLFYRVVFALTLILYAVEACLPAVFELLSALTLKLTNNERKRIHKDVFSRIAINAILVADSAFNSADAIIRTLSRLKSKQKLLEWQTAMQAESGNKNSVKYYYGVMLNSTVFGIIIALAAAALLHPLRAAIGFMFVLAPVVIFKVSAERKRRELKLTAEQEHIIEYTAKGAWKYFLELANEKNNYLPPDNYQEEPYKADVARTSPTNIGMLLVGCVAAEILGFAKKRDAVLIMNNALNTLYKLEKWNGHPYNWYDTTTLKPLQPKFVSSADNGNLACCLIAARQALLSYKDNVHDPDIIVKLNESLTIIGSLLKNMDFSLLYDEKKELLSVGYDTNEGKLSEYAYDLLASEARQASFYAIISGAVPVKHWRRLSRIVVRRDGKYILKSWSGSMFEYLMPALLMRTYDDTLWSRVFDGVITEQMKYSSKVKRPWGISESGYWLFDDDKYYQYKAFGIPYAAVRHIKTDEYVVAPYACALSLPFKPILAAKNLIAMKEMGMCGRFGFYEAADMSGDTKNIIKSYMAHHEGMSLIAAANCLHKDSIIELFHSAPEVKAGELLLQERLPSVVQPDVVPKKAADKTPQIVTENMEEIYNGITKHPHCTILTNGAYSTVVSNSGSNMSFTDKIMVNKWKSDEITEHYGHFIFIKDRDANTAYSVTLSPMYSKCSYSAVAFKPDSVTFAKRVRGVDSNLNITVSPDHNATVYSLTVKNTQNKPKKLIIADYMEAALEAEEESAAHPSYSDMFIESKFLKENNVLVVERTPRVEDKSRQYMALMLVGPNNIDVHPVTSRYDFIGRNRTIMNPRFADADFNYENVQNSKMAPCASLGVEIELPQGTSANLTYIVAYADNYGEILNITGHFRTADNCKRAFELAYEHSKISMRYRLIDAKQYRLINSVLTRLYYPWSFKRNTTACSKQFLWQFGISGDIPIICYNMTSSDESGLRLMLNVYDYIASGGVKVDLVVITYDDGYHKSCYETAQSVTATSARRDMLGKKGGIFIIRREVNPHESTLLSSYADISVQGSEAQIYSSLIFEDSYITKENISILPKLVKRDSSSQLMMPKLTYFNGYGGFDEQKSEYTIVLDNGINTPAPWSNIMANGNFGTLVTESGGGYTWYKNSRENKLTAWCNDPVSDVPSEAVYIKDDSTMQYVNPSRVVASTGRYIISYGLGYARYQHSANKLNVTQTVFVPPADSIKVSVIDIVNDSDVTKKLSVYYYVDCNLSPNTSRSKDDISVMTEKTGGIAYAQNMNVPENGYMFAGCSRTIESVLTKKIDFFGKTGNFAHPRALDYSTWNTALGRRAADCIVIKTSIEIKPHYSGRTVLFLGGAENLESIREMRKKYSGAERSANLLKSTAEHYSKITRPFTITTNDKPLDLLFNNFLMYQAYVCRYNAKTSFYQCSGAFGFRDQLQDALAFMYCDRHEARNHILRAARQQFEEGDVRHWWHEATGYGIRTKISDDLVFLPYVCCEYARFSDDWGIFDEQVPFVKGQEIEQGKNSNFGKAYFSENKASMYTHCMLALKRSLRIGVHGLPLIGTGDWNDGFDKVGENGKGESVWLAFFIHYVMKNFTEVAKRYNNTEDMKFLAESCSMLENGIKQSAWDGKWYRRAYYDDSTPIGSEQCEECKIDVIVQAWAAIADITPKEQVAQALDSVEKYLVDSQTGIVKLFTPPFKNTDHNPGYIKAYKSGIRENGGQYTHGAIWLAAAYAVRGEAQKAVRILRMLNPVNHSSSKEDADVYKVEPYVIAADVYSIDTDRGMGGWTWYTGSAAWMYKVILENILGIKITGDIMTVTPVVPYSMLPFRVEYNHNSNGIITKYIIDVLSSDETESCEVDSENCPDGKIKLLSDGKTHKVVITPGNHSRE